MRPLQTAVRLLFHKYAAFDRLIVHFFADDGVLALLLDRRSKQASESRQISRYLRHGIASLGAPADGECHDLLNYSLSTVLLLYAEPLSFDIVTAFSLLLPRIGTLPVLVYCALQDR